MIDSIGNSILYYFGIYIVILFVFSLISNGILIRKYVENRQYLSNIHLLKFAIVILNTVGTLISLPIVALRAFSYK